MEESIPCIKVIGVGGAGGRVINRLYTIDIGSAELIAIDLDKKHLNAIRADKKVCMSKPLIRRSKNRGCQSEIGELTAEMTQDVIREALRGTDFAFIVAGMGGDVGTGASPVIARIARELGAFVVGIAIMPLENEEARLLDANGYIGALREEMDLLIPLDNNCLRGYVPDAEPQDLFSVMDQMVAELIKGISETMDRPSLVNFDFDELKAIAQPGSIGIMTLAELKRDPGMDNMIFYILRNKMYDADYRVANNLLLQFTGGPDMTLEDVEKIGNALDEELGRHYTIVRGARQDRQFKGSIKVASIFVLDDM